MGLALTGLSGVSAVVSVKQTKRPNPVTASWDGTTLATDFGQPVAESYFDAARFIFNGRDGKGSFPVVNGVCSFAFNPAYNPTPPFLLAIAANTVTSASSGLGNDGYTDFPVTDARPVSPPPAGGDPFADYPDGASITYLQANGGLWQDAAKTVPADTDGDPVEAFGHWLKSPNYNAATLTDMGNGTWGLTFDTECGYVRDDALDLSGATTIAVRASQSDQSGAYSRIVQSATVNTVLSLTRQSPSNFCDGTIVNDALVAPSSDLHTVVLTKGGGKVSWQAYLDGGSNLSDQEAQANWGQPVLGPPGYYSDGFTGILTAVVCAALDLTDGTARADFTAIMDTA